MTTRTKTESQRIDLQDGRRVHVLTYDDGSIRFRVTGGAPYALTEAYMAGGSPTILKLATLAGISREGNHANNQH